MYQFLSESAEFYDKKHFGVLFSWTGVYHRVITNTRLTSQLHVRCITQ